MAALHSSSYPVIPIDFVIRWPEVEQMLKVLSRFLNYVSQG